MTQAQTILTNLRSRGHQVNLVDKSMIKIFPPLQDTILKGLRPHVPSLKRELLYEADHPDVDQDRAVNGTLKLIKKGKPTIVAITGAAGTGKSYLLKRLSVALPDAIITAPTHKAAHVLMQKGVTATTVKSATQIPLWTPERDELLDYLDNLRQNPPAIFSDLNFNNAFKISAKHDSQTALKSLNISTFDERLFYGWGVQDHEHPIMIIDEASMVSSSELEKIRGLAKIIILLGDPNQLPPVKSKGGMSLDCAEYSFGLSKVRRQSNDSGILDLAYAVLRNCPPSRLLEMAQTLSGVHVFDHIPSETLWSAPLLCWKNETRINAYLDWREFNNLKTERLSRNEPLICTGYSNTKAADTTLFINGSRWRVDKPIWNPAAIMVRDEITNLSHTVSADVSEDGNYKGGDAVPSFKSGHGGAYFRHGAAITIHQSQGSQYPTGVIAWPDIVAAYHADKRVDQRGLRLWQRLAYVAITRAEHNCILCTRLEMG